jgi:hypothetical protein
VNRCTLFHPITSASRTALSKLTLKMKIEFGFLAAFIIKII